MKDPSVEEIVDGIRHYTRPQILRVVKRTDSKTIDELLEVVCPVPEQKKLHRHFIMELIDEGLIEVSTKHQKIVMTAKGNEETLHVPEHPPRELTCREAQERFIKSLMRIALEWHGHENKTEWEKMEGMLFSILSMIDGSSCAEPGFDLIASQSEEDIAYHAEHGEDWYPVDEAFNDIPLHEIFHDVVRDMRPKAK